MKGRLCVECLADERARRKAIVRIDHTRPHRIPGVVQRVLTYTPATCPTCRGGPMRDLGRMVGCFMCGRTWLLIPEETAHA